MTEPSPSTNPARAALAVPDFRWFFIGNAVSQTGSYVQNAAVAVLVFDLTGRNTAVGLTTAFMFMPVLLLALVGGELADRFDRRMIFVSTQVLSVASVAALAVVTGLGHVTPGWIYATSIVLGVGYALSIPTMHALIPSLVPPRSLGPAIGLTAVTFNLARVVGPVLAAAALVAVGYTWAFSLNALTFVVFIVALMLIRPRPAVVQEGRATLRDGLRAAWDDRAVRGMLLGIAALAVALDPVNTLSPAFAVDVFGRSGAAAPIYVTAYGAGSIAAAFGIGRLFRHAEANVRLGALTLSLMALGMIGFGLSPTYEAGLVALFVAGVGGLATITLFTTGIQQRVPDRVRGRVMAIWTLCALGMRFPAGVVDGVLADWLGPRAAVLILQVPLALLVGFVLWRLPPVRGHAEPASMEFAE
ncbi:MAG: MFS transporter [Actinomycetota bacterium]